MSKAKDIASYLEETGFDISSLKESKNTQLVAKVDKSKLFVCGDNKYGQLGLGDCELVYVYEKLHQNFLKYKHNINNTISINTDDIIEL